MPGSGSDDLSRDPGAGEEERLSGGNSSAGVVRIGTTVCKPWLATTERTVAYLVALRQRIDSASRGHA